MLNMTDTFTTLLSAVSQTVDYESGSGSGTEDYDFEGSICDKSVVRRFRMYYEPPLFLLIVLLGFIGNLMVLWIYAHFKNRLKTMTDVYLLNLALADLLFLCTLPLWAVDAMKGWSFGTVLCKATSALYKINFFSSMFLLTCISVDRYISIVQSTKAQNSKEKRLACSKVVCVFVWLLATILSIPELIFAQTKENDSNTFCTMVYWNNENNQTKIIVLALQISMGFCIPLLVMIYCYSVIIRTLLKAKNFEKHKALRVILAVVTVFILSQLPYNSMLVVEATQAANTTITDCNVARSFDIFTQVLKSVAYMHSCLNPFLYAFIGVRFRKDLLKLYKKYGCTMSKSGKQGGPLRPSVMSDTESTVAFSL